jgi:hypothetical protein
MVFKHKDLKVISFKFNTQQVDPLGGVLFALVHLHVLRPIATTHPTYVFPSLANDMYIVGPTLYMLSIFLQLQEEFGTLRLSMQPTKLHLDLHKG